MTPETIKFPFGEADVPAVTLASGTASIEVGNNMTVVDFGTLGENATLDVTAHKDLSTGAVIVVKAASDGTARSVTFGNGCQAVAMAGTINKTKTKMLVFDGLNFVGINEQID